MANLLNHRALSRVSLKVFAAWWMAMVSVCWQASGQGASVASVNPVPATSVTNLALVTVVFIKPVLGVRADDLILNGSSGTNVIGTGAVYTFSFSPPNAGIVEASWNGAHNITDLLGNRLNDLGANTTWSYTLIDNVPPTVTTIGPLPGSSLSHLTQVTVTFSEPVLGVDAADLLVNGVPATQVTGSGTGPYTFGFASPAPGTVQLSWAPNHGIHDLASSPNSFAGGNWSYTLHPGEFSGDVIINEFLASNVSTNGLRDEDGELQDWIELYNRGASVVNLNGWSLTDDPTQPDMWLLPAVAVLPGEYLVIFASGKDRRPSDGGNLHANFKLSPGGQYLGLFNANLPRDVATQFVPAYPQQRANISYGLYNGSFGYLTNASPGAANSGLVSFSGVVADPKASVQSGFFNSPFSLTLSTPTVGASLLYTLDGSEPTLTSGIPYSGPINIAGSASRAVINVRALAFKAGMLTSRVTTHSYIFPQFVLTQPPNPAGFPDTWMTQTNVATSNVTVIPADYEMDPKIITNSAYTALAAQGLTNLPTLSIVADVNDLFGQNGGIYANPNPQLADRPSWERTASAELIMPDGSAGFRMNAGLRIQGGTSRDPNWTRKHSLRLFFKDAYDGTLHFPLFPDSPITTFHTLLLKAGFNLSWNNRFESGGYHNLFVRDKFCSDLLLEMNRAGSHGRFVHVYLNGLYWGLYNLHERPDGDFAASYFGGDNSEYDVVRNTDGYFELLKGDTNAWTSMMALVNSGLSDNAQYEQLQQYLDVDGFIDYMIVNQYVGNTDWANHNWYAFRKRAPGAGYEFQSWDAEIVMRNVNENNTGYNQTQTPTMIQSFLRNNAEYRLKFADHVQKYFFNGGPLYVNTNNPVIDPANSQNNLPGALFMKRIQEVNPAVVLESARWGDSALGRTNNPFSQADFLTELNWMTNTYLPKRSAVVLNQYVMQVLYPGSFGVPTPTFNQQGGYVPPGFNLIISAPIGTIYYTTNGSDPRTYGTDAVSTNAIAYASPVAINSTTRIKARAFNGTAWSPVNDATFTAAPAILPLRITEIMYLPVGGDTYQYLELKNFGATTLDLTGWSISGISFAFPVGFTIAPGAVIIIASGVNPAAFAARYPGLNVAAWFSGKLASAGERIAIKDAQDRTVFAVNFSNTGGWPIPAVGYSLEINDPAGDPDDPANWRVSAGVNGTPGTISVVPPLGTVQLNEVMALNSSTLTNGGTTPDWLEIVNTGAAGVNLAGWSLSNDGNPRKFVFRNPTSLPAGGYLLVYCDTQTNAPGLHSGFALSGQGEHLFLYDAQSRRVDAVSFGPQVPNLSLGRVGVGWHLTLPTPGGLNQLAELGPPAYLVINEWLANSAPGQSDWLEIYNPSGLPIPLSGLYLGTSNELFQITSYSFAAPGGYVQLFADESPGPNHLDFKLPAEGNTIALHDSFGTEINRVNYGQQLDGISQGRYPDGTPNIVSFPGSASPGTTNFVVTFAGPRINELMARNESSVVNPWGQYSDWLELHNPGTNSFDLSGMSLSLDQSTPGQWIFPAGATIAAGGYLTIWCDGSRDATTNLQANLNTGHALDGNSGGAYLFNAAGQVVDYVEYGAQISNQSIGRSGESWRLLSSATPGATNSSPAMLGAVSGLRFNEWMAAPISGDDWFELYNTNAQPVDLSGLYFTDDPSIAGQMKFAVAPLSFISGHGWVEFHADGHPVNGRNHVNFQLASSGQSLRLYDTNLNLIDGVDFAVQQPGISQGRLPDGGIGVTSFPTSPTPGQANYVPMTGVVWNEALTHTDPPLEDAIELANSTTSPIYIGGWFLSDSESEPKKFRIPDGTWIPANGFRVFYEYQFNPTPGVFPSFALDSAHGDALYLSAADSNSNLYGFRADVKFGAAENGVSFGRYTNSTGVEFVAMSQHTFGVDNPASLAQFRTGTGLSNAYPKVGPIVISEIMYHPVTVVGTNLVENPDEEFVELYNLSTTNVPLYLPAFPANTWKLKGGINFSFPTGAAMPPQSYAIVVHFDPVTNASALAAFQTRFGLSTNTPIYGPFNGRLANEGDTVELYKPDEPSPPPDAGFVPFIQVDHVSYLPTAPWQTAAAGGGASLQRRVAKDFGNDPLNWKAEPPTAGGTNNATGVVAPIITRQPQDTSVSVGTIGTLSVSAAGTAPLTYRWQRNGVNVLGGTSAVLNVYNAQPNNSSSYRVWVSNAAGTICSQPATLTVLQAPVITGQPAGMTVSVGSAATLQVKAAGTAPLSYQWYLNSLVVAGATASTLPLAPVDASQAGIYQVVVTNSVGMVASAPAELKVIGLDSDGDGIPDSWMLQYFDHPTGLAIDHSRAQDDADGDGMSNLQEFLAGTNPLDAQSSLKLRAQAVNPATGRPQFAFTAIAGVGYTLQYCDNLGSGIWIKLRDYPADPTTRTVIVNDPGAANSPARFYRLLTPIQSSSNADSDRDGIPDSWMLQYFGHPTGLAIDNSRVQDDADGDGMSNLQEYLAGTDPLDAQSVLRLRALDTDVTTGRPQFEFTAMAGIGYTLLYSDGLTPPVWRKLVDVPVDVTTRAYLVDDPASAGVPMRFYRVVTPIQSFWDPDSDGDGIPDSWMLQIFGHATGSASDHSRAQDDADGDGMSNLQEYRAGTDPLDAQSCLKLQFQDMDSTTGRPQFSFEAMPGIGYTIQFSDSLTSGVWQKLRDEGAGDSIRTVTLTDPSASNAASRFYRIVTPAQP
jgi:hypothetical protein